MATTTKVPTAVTSDSTIFNSTSIPSPVVSVSANSPNNKNKINSVPPAASITPALVSSPPLQTSTNNSAVSSVPRATPNNANSLGDSSVDKKPISPAPPAASQGPVPSVPRVNTADLQTVKSASASPSVIKPPDSKCEMLNGKPKVVTQPPLPAPATQQIINQPLNKISTTEETKNINNKGITGGPLISEQKMDIKSGQSEATLSKQPAVITEPQKRPPTVINKEVTDSTRKVIDEPKKEEIGEDVKRIMAAIENAGLCGPKLPEQDGGRVLDSGGGGDNKASKITRPATAHPSTIPGSKATGPTSSPSVPVFTSEKDSPRGSPSSTQKPTQKHSPSNNGAPKIPRLATADTSKGKAAPASGTSSSHPAEVSPRPATSIRTSVPRSTSAKSGHTAPTTAKSPSDNNKSTKTKVNGVDSASACVEVEAGTRSTAAGASQKPTPPRPRPSSSLYRPTTSSALKGVSSPANKSSSNQHLELNTVTPRPTKSASSARSSRSAITMGDSAGGSGDGKPATLRDQFAAFSRFGNKDEDGKSITLSNCDKWMKQAKVIDGKKITTTDTSICFKKLFKTAKKVSFEDFKKYVEELAKTKKMEPQEILDKLEKCGTPGLSSATKAAHSNVVDRLTDTSKYTGSHKERFDASGKGRGIEGRKDTPDGSGYVAAFKDKLDLKDAAEKKEEST